MAMGRQIGGASSRHGDLDRREGRPTRIAENIADRPDVEARRWDTFSESQLQYPPLSDSCGPHID